MEAGSVESVNRPDMHTYIFRHNIATPGKVFYRLRINELNGTFNYSPTIALGSKEKTGAEVYPTLITSGLISINAASPVQRVDLITTSGQRVLSRTMSGATGYFQLPLPSVPRGVYYLQIAGKDFHQTDKIIVR